MGFEPVPPIQIDIIQEESQVILAGDITRLAPSCGRPDHYRFVLCDTDVGNHRFVFNDSK